MELRKEVKVIVIPNRKDPMDLIISITSIEMILILLTTKLDKLKTTVNCPTLSI